jgi:type 1 glutamine amidotransferase
MDWKFNGAMLALAAVTAMGQPSSPAKVLIVTGGHDFDKNAFASLWQSTGSEVTQRALSVGHEIFETTENFPYDILVFYNHQNPGDKLTAKHQDNFRKLLDQGVGIFVLHHSVAAYPHFSDFGEMTGGRYRSANYFSDNISTWKKPVDIPCTVTDTQSPLTQSLSPSFVVNDEIYMKMTFASDNEVLVKTSYVGAEGPIAWVRKAGNSRVFTTILGDSPGSFAQPDFRALVKNGLAHIRPCGEGDTRLECGGQVSLVSPRRNSGTAKKITLVSTFIPSVYRNGGNEGIANSYRLNGRSRRLTPNP